MLKPGQVAAALLATAVLGTIAAVSDAVEPDPRLEAIPALDTVNTCKSFVVRLKFKSYTDVSLLSAQVVRGCPPERVGGPPLIGLKLTSSGGCDIETISAWHPLWRFTSTHQSEKLEILPSGEGRFVLPYYRYARKLQVSDIPANRELISVDLKDAIQGYCAAYPHDMDCAPTVSLSDRARLIYALLDFPTRVWAGQDIPKRTARICDAGGTTATGAPPAGGGPIDIVLVPVSTTFGESSSMGKSDASKAETPHPIEISLNMKEATIPRLKSGGTADRKLDLNVPKSVKPGWYCVKMRSRAGKEPRELFEEQGNCRLVEVVLPSKSLQTAD
jgi:hypothetical protein